MLSETLFQCKAIKACLGKTKRFFLSTFGAIHRLLFGYNQEFLPYTRTGPWGACTLVREQWKCPRSIGLLRLVRISICLAIFFLPTRDTDLLVPKKPNAGPINGDNKGKAVWPSFVNSTTRPCAACFISRSRHAFVNSRFNHLPFGGHSNSSFWTGFCVGEKVLQFGAIAVLRIDQLFRTHNRLRGYLPWDCILPDPGTLWDGFTITTKENISR